MDIKFIKAHPAGIEKGRIITNAAKPFADRMIEQGYAEEVKKKEDKPAKARRTKGLKSDIDTK